VRRLGIIGNAPTCDFRQGLSERLSREARCSDYDCSPRPYTDSNPQKCFCVATADNRQKVGNGRSAAVRLYLSCCSYWRSLGDSAVNFRNADKSEGNRITCSLSDTTCVYHRQSSGGVE